jgi:hypothetical protein
LIPSNVRLGPLLSTVADGARWRSDPAELFPSKQFWADGIESCLAFALARGQFEDFLPRLKRGRTRERDAALAELAAAFMFERDGFPVVEWRPKGRKRQAGGMATGEFSFACAGTHVFTEVKRPSWQAELSDEGRLARKALPKYIGEVRSLDNTKPIRDVVTHAAEQCSGLVASLCVVADDLYIGPQQEKWSCEVALFSPKRIGHDTGYLAHNGAFLKPQNASLGGVMFMWPESPDRRSATLAWGQRLYVNPNATKLARLPDLFVAAYRGVEVPDYRP